MARRHYRDFAYANNPATGDLVLVAFPEITVYDAGTTNPISQTLYAAATGGTTKPNPFTGNADGSFDFYVDAGDDIKVVVDGAAGGGGIATADWEHIPIDPDIMYQPFAILGNSNPEFGGAMVDPDGALLVGKQVANGAGVGNGASTMIVNRTSSTSGGGENMVVMDFTQRLLNADSSTISIVAAQGKLANRSDPTEFLPTGAASALRGIELRMLSGTWAGLIGATPHQIWGIGLGFETNTAVPDAGGLNANKEVGILLDCTANVGQFLDAPTTGVSANSGQFVGGAQNSGPRQSAWEWILYAAGIAVNDGIFCVKGDSKTGIGRVPLVNEGVLQVRQLGDSRNGGARFYLDSDATRFGGVYAVGDTAFLEAWNISAAHGGSARVSSAAGDAAFKVLSVVGLSGPLMQLEHGTNGVMYEISSAGRVSIQGNQVLKERQTGWAVISGTATGTDAAMVNALRDAMNAARLAFNTSGHGAVTTI